MDQTRETVKLSAGTYAASLSVVGKTVILDGIGATLNATSSASAFSIGAGARLHVVGLSIVNLNATEAVDCESSTAVPTFELDQASIDSVGVPIYGDPCSITITQAKIHGRTAGNFAFLAAGNGSVATIDRSLFDGGDGVVAGAQATVRVTNSVISNQTGPDGAFIGGELLGSSPGSMFVSFSTVVNSLVKCGSGVPICAAGTAPGACIDNSIVFNGGSDVPSDTVSGSACNATYVLAYPQSSALVGGNDMLGVNPALSDPGNGDYHLQASSPAVDAADPSATDPIDYDGVSRPQGPRSDLGAFEYKP
ncbi:MAG TPA: choice-of-anchor Q domain-containing protein [Kofleriaceae bacterium]|nr:choice-of-anchor Q domain-containing protein [Kofleriaceae bacterium]